MAHSSQHDQTPWLAACLLFLALSFPGTQAQIVGRTSSTSAASAITWNVASISSDLGCTKSAFPVLTAGNFTRCQENEFFVAAGISVGQCSLCSNITTPKPGYYCSKGHLVRCPNGRFCPTILTNIECPADHWCRDGFTEPLPCRPFVRCLAGSTKQLAGAGSIVGLLIFNCLAACLTCGFRYRRVSEEERVRVEAAKLGDDDVELVGAFSADVPPVAMEFEDLTMHLKTNGKCVLSGVTGKFPASSLVALMGPSGGGKTTFMNALCGRSSYGTVTGKIKINGVSGGVQDIPRRVGFVPQDDIMHADLTVHQILHYNALLRLPASASKSEALTHTNKVINVLALNKVAHNIVGDPERRGISGGQKKRVNIGMELVAMPSVIFMDEPTSGLDGAATVQLARCLSELRNSGLTIICVIHQPRFAVFEAFTHLLLLGAGGRMVYCGETPRMMQYFVEQQFRLPQRENPADWMIDIVCGLAPRYKSPEPDAGIDESFVAPDTLFDIWDNNFKGKLSLYSGPAEPNPSPIKGDRRTPGRLWQTWIFLVRNSRQWSVWSFMVALVLLFLCGAIFGIIMQNLLDFSYQGLFASLTGNGFIFYMICTINARAIFGNERLQYMREFKSGMSSSAYWLAKVLFSLINVVMYALAFALPLYWLGVVPAMDFGKYLLVFILASWYHQGLGMAFSVLFSSPTTSLLLCVFVPMLLQLAFAGTLIKISEMSTGQKVLSALSCGRWYNQELYVTELLQYPSHVLEFSEVMTQLNSIEVSVPLDDNTGRGLINLLILGIALRIWTLIMLAMLKYSEGGCCIWQIVFIGSKCLRRLDMHVAPDGVKVGDTVETHPARPKKPSASPAFGLMRVKAVGGALASE